MASILLEGIIDREMRERDIKTLKLLLATTAGSGESFAAKKSKKENSVKTFHYRQDSLFR